MLILKLAEDCLMDKKTRTKDGDMVRLSDYTAQFILSYVIHCMGAGETSLALSETRAHV